MTERIVARIDLNPETAQVVERALGQVLDYVTVQLSHEPVPQHTKRALDAQREHLEAARRAVRLAAANLVQLDHDGKPVEL